MTFPLRRILWALLLMTSPAWAGSPVESVSPPWPWPDAIDTPPERGTQDTSQLLDWMLSADIAQRSEAQIRLLPQGAALLPQLESLAARRARRDERDRMREYLQILSARYLYLQQLAAYPTLNALAQESVRQGLEAVAPWEGMESTTGIVLESQSSCGLAPPPLELLKVKGPPLLSLLNTLGHLGGLAQPAIERLLSSPQAPVRLLGMALAQRLGVRPDAASLERLRADPAEVLVEAKWVMDPRRSLPPKTSSLSQLAKDLTDGLDMAMAHPAIEPWPAGEWFAIATIPGYDWRGLHPALGVEPTPGSVVPWADCGRSVLPGPAPSDARGAQEYWNGVRSTWRTWWKGHPWRRDGQSIDNLLLRASGVQDLDAIQRESHLPFLRVEGPAGLPVEVRQYVDGGRTPVSFRQGVLPFTLEESPPERLSALRVRIGCVWVDVSRSFPEPHDRSHHLTFWVNPKLLLASFKRRNADVWRGRGLSEDEALRCDARAEAP